MYFFNFIIISLLLIYVNEMNMARSTSPKMGQQLVVMLLPTTVTNVVIYFLCQIIGRKKIFSQKLDREQKKDRKLPHFTASKLNIFFSPIVSFYRKYFHLQGTFFLFNTNSKKTFISFSSFSLKPFFPFLFHLFKTLNKCKRGG